MRRIVFGPMILGLGLACTAQNGPGPAARLSAGLSDTIIVNSTTATPLPVRALDAGGRELPAAQIRFARASGDTIRISSAGVTTCTTRADAVVHAVLGGLSKSLLVRCRPVARIQLPGPVQFVLGDSALSQPFELPVVAYGADRRPVALIAGIVHVLDSTKAYVRGNTLVPRSRGTTLVGVWVGRESAATGVHVYQRVESFDAIDTLLRVEIYHRQFAVPIRLRPGELRRHALPPGSWMMTMLSRGNEHPAGFRLQFENASCQDSILNDPGRFICHSSSGSVIVSRQTNGTDTVPVSAYLLVQGLNGGDEADFELPVACLPMKVAQKIAQTQLGPESVVRIPPGSRVVRVHSTPEKLAELKSTFQATAKAQRSCDTTPGGSQ